MLIYTATNFFVKLFPFLLLPIITHSLSLEGFGEYAIYKATINFAIPITGLCLSSAIIRRYYDQDELDFSKYLSTTLIFLGLNIAVVLLLVAPFASHYSRDVVGIDANVFLISLSVSFCTGIITINQGLLRCMNRPYIFAAFNLSQAVSLFAGIIIYNKVSTATLLGYVLVELSVSVLFVILCIFYINSSFKLSFSFDFSYLRNAIKYVSPIIPYSIMAYAFSISDRYIIHNYLGNKSVALYSAAFQIASILQVLAVSFNAVWTPWVFAFLKGRKNIKDLYKKQIMISIVFIVIALLFAIIGPYFILYFLGSKYRESLGLFKWFVISNLIQAIYWVVSPILVFFAKNKYLLYASCIALIFSISLNLSLITRLGVSFVAFVNSLSWLISLLITLFYTFKIIKKEYAK